MCRIIKPARPQSRFVRAGIVALDFSLPLTTMFRRQKLVYSSLVWPVWQWKMSLARLRIVGAPWTLGPLSSEDNAKAGSLGQTRCSMRKQRHLPACRDQ